MPFHDIGSRVTVELVPHVEQVLDASDVDVVNAGEIKDYGFEGGTPCLERCLLCRVLWPGVVPGAVAGVSGEGEWVATACVGEDVGDKRFGVVCGIGVEKALREAVDEDARVRVDDIECGI